MIEFGFRKKVPVLYQAEEAECGLACVAMIAAYHGYQVGLSQLRQSFPISLKGATVSDLSDIASDLNMTASAYRIEPEDLCDMELPAILHWNLCHFVVVTKILKDGISVIDPMFGTKKVGHAEVNRKFTGIILELTPTPDFKKERNRAKLSISALVNIDSRKWGVFLQGILLTLALQFFVLLTPYYLQLVVDKVLANSSADMLKYVALAFLAIIVFDSVAKFIRGLVFQYLGTVISYEMKSTLFHHMIRLPLPYFEKRSIGDIQQRFFSLQPIRDLLVDGAIEGATDSIFVISIGVILFIYSPILALLTIFFIGMYAVLRAMFVGFLHHLEMDQLVAEGREEARFLETLRAIQTIKMSGVEVQRERIWRGLAVDSVNARIRLGNIEIAYNSLSSFVLGASHVVAVYVAATISLRGDMTIGMIMAFLAYKVLFEQRLMNVVERLVQYRLLSVHLQRAADIALEPCEVSANRVLQDWEGDVELLNVDFAYSKIDPPVLHDVSLHIPPGDFVAFAGPSGQGKSTLIKLIVGLYEPTRGKILYGRQDARYWGIRNIRSQMGVVLQDDTLLTGSIMDNLTLFDPNPNRERAVWAAQIASIHEEIMQMPMDYYSLVGDMGTVLSGGQSQRIMIARALYRRPRFLVLDEGTSALDLANERRIAAALSEMNVTRIVAAHRPQTLELADRVYLVQGGRISLMSVDPQKKNL